MGTGEGRRACIGSTILSPERRIGTIFMDEGETSSTGYSYPRGETSFPTSAVVRPWANASQPTIVAMSCTRALVSLAFVEADLSWLSFARTHGCAETCALDGRVGAILLGDDKSRGGWEGQRALLGYGLGRYSLRFQANGTSTGKGRLPACQLASLPALH